MSGTERAFIDTNVIVYLFSGDAAKADRAEAAIGAGGVVSIQVLNEFVAVARRKLDLSWAEIRETLTALRANAHVTPLTLAAHERALDLAEQLGLHIYDAQIVAAAIEAGCTEIFSEDMQHGHVIDGVRIANPFRAP